MLLRLPNWQPLLMSWIESLSSSTHDRERGTALDWVNSALFLISPLSVKWRIYKGQNLLSPKKPRIQGFIQEGIWQRFDYGK
jgi:hypothetical protein